MDRPMTEFGTIVFLKRTSPGRLIGYVRPEGRTAREDNLWFGELSTQGRDADMREGLRVGYERATKGTDRIFKLWPV
jgi:hypothetical protein